MSSNTKNTIEYWRPGNGDVIVYPHIEFDSLFTHNEIGDIIFNIQNELFGDNMIIYGDNDYCYEVNGKWNICFSVNCDNISYTYLIRRDKQLNKSYACPFVRTRGECVRALNKINSPKLFKKLEDYLLFVFNNPKKINCFKTTYD